MADKPVLWLKTEPRSSKPRGGGSKKRIPAQFPERQRELLRAIEALVRPDADRPRWFAGRGLFWIGMAGSQAASHLPDSIFAPELGIEIVAPWRSGYVAEIPVVARDGLLDRVGNPSSKEQKIAIARIRTFKPLHESLTQGTVKRAWRDARTGSRGPRAFTAQLPPFRSPEARTAVMADLAGENGIPVRLRLPSHMASPIDQPQPEQSGSDASLPAARDAQPTVFEHARAQFIKGDYPGLLVEARSWEELWEASGRGLIVRWDPVTPLAPARANSGPEPELDRPVSVDDPIVGVIDGGHSTRRYRAAVAWEEDPFPLALPLDLEHGNIVAGLLVEGYAWNLHLEKLPKIDCRLGIVPAVPKSGAVTRWDPDALIQYLDGVFSRHPDTKVWNISANALHACSPDHVSPLGHHLARLARRHRILLVIATGNRRPDKPERIAPPADAEAAIVVAGRQSNLVGVSGPCPVSRTGLGPDRMRKPELSWYSGLRVLGGRFGEASSWATPLVSSAAAHTWKALSDPSPDLVRAILLATTEHNTQDDDNPRLQRKTYDHRLGFGSPFQITAPWATAGHAILLVWRGSISEKLDYLWEDILLPPSLTKGGVFRGHARLVCVLNPQTNQKGTNYFSTRVEASLQYEEKPEKWKQMIGGLKTSTAEGIARSIDYKWDPVRFYSGTFGLKKKPPLLANPRLRVRARLYWRDRYLYPGVDLESQEREVTFAVLLEGLDRKLPVHEEFVEIMGEQIEAAVILPVVQTVQGNIGSD